MVRKISQMIQYSEEICGNITRNIYTKRTGDFQECDILVYEYRQNRNRGKNALFSIFIAF